MTAPDERGNGTGPLLVLVRHGQTDSNVGLVLDSRPPGAPLNATGRAQAESVADLLAGEPVRAVYASVAPRAQQTAAVIAARHRLAVEVVPDVQEVFVGDLEGRSDHDARAQFEQVYAAWGAGRLELRLPGGESAIEVRDRFLPAVTELWRRHTDRPDGVVVVVSHGGAIRMAAGAMLGEFADTRYVPNAGRVVLAPHPGTPTGWLLEHWDDGSALPGDVTGGAHER